MATGTILLLPSSATLPDGTSNNAAPGITRQRSSFAAGANAPKVHFLTLDFDATTDEHCFWVFRTPENYASSPVLKIQWIANATSNSCIFVSKIGSITVGDTDTPFEHVQSSDNSVTTATNSTEANRLNETSITLTNNDTLLPGDLIMITLFRDASAAGDTLTVDARVLAVSLEYTTT